MCIRDRNDGNAQKNVTSKMKQAVENKEEVKTNIQTYTTADAVFFVLLYLIICNLSVNNKTCLLYTSTVDNR